MYTSEQLLRNSNLKVTPQRLSILNTLDEFGHMEIYAIYEQVLKEHSYVSLATIYKNIATLQNAKLVKEVSVSGRKSLYEIDRRDGHGHKVCKSCNNVEDISLDTQNTIKYADDDFTVESIELVLFGLCGECKLDDKDHNDNLPKNTVTTL